MEKILCTSYNFWISGKRDSCIGDAGGPLVARDLSDDPWYQVGVRSNKQGNKCKDNIPGVYTKIEAFMPWIEENLKQ